DARTDAQGRALVHWSTEVGELTTPVTVIARGFAKTTVRCAPGVGTPPQTRVVLAAGHRIEGVVREADGRPASAEVTAATDDLSTPQTPRGAPDGPFSFDDSPAEPAKVTASDRSGRAAQTEATPGGPPVEIVLAPRGWKTSTVVVSLIREEDGEPL